MKTNYIYLLVIILLTLSNKRAYSEDNLNISNTNIDSKDSLNVSKKIWSLHDCMKYGVNHSLKIRIKDLNNKDIHIDKKEAVLNFQIGRAHV